MPEALLDVRGLRLSFGTEEGTARALFGVSFSVDPAETVGLVGESGCGKTVTALSVLRLLPSPPAVVEGGETRFRGEDLLALPERRMCAVRGKSISMIFQEPMSSLNPVLTVGEQVAEVFTAHKVCGKREAAERAVEWLRKVGMPDPGRRAREYPHQLSGGMRQRGMIAMALALEPALLIADEPTTALDVTIQAQILELIKEIQARTGTALLLITHDLGVVAETVQHIAVMYAGRIVEQGTAEQVLLDPKHPYTQGLLSSIPGKQRRGQQLSVIKGVVPNPFRMPPGCKFEPRCPYAWSLCHTQEPPLEESPGDGRTVRCFLHTPEGAPHRAAFEQAAAAAVRGVVAG